MIRDNKGFTLIEIIAVLVVLGILAAYAIPRFYNLQTEARTKAVAAAIAALQSQATMLYAKQVLRGEASFTRWRCPPGHYQFNVGDYYGTVACPHVMEEVGGTKGLVARIDGPLDLINGVRNEDLRKTFDLVN